jgi:hypothetical protein
MSDPDHRDVRDGLPFAVQMMINELTFLFFDHRLKTHFNPSILRYFTEGVSSVASQL